MIERPQSRSPFEGGVIDLTVLTGAAVLIAGVLSVFAPPAAADGPAPAPIPAPPASAAWPPIEDCGRYFCPCPDVFRLPTEPDAWGSRHMLLFGSPYGRGDIVCHYDRTNGFLDAWQKGIDGYHQLYNVQTLSSAQTGRVYLWNPVGVRENL
ncbi:hypothetical protein [Nocardia brevicatena]|uniref:hypothetical protein n=1 Tax=Nocardia brevicatena TaxID=37327 RepID=UPI0002F69216|nr:hypothetical protein [Nocardia brevicatena]